MLRGIQRPHGGEGKIADLGSQEAVALLAMEARPHRKRSEDRRVDVRLGVDRRMGGGNEVGCRWRFDEVDRLHVADIMIVPAIAPGPFARDFQVGELLARQQLRADHPIRPWSALLTTSLTIGSPRTLKSSTHSVPVFSAGPVPSSRWRVSR